MTTYRWTFEQDVEQYSRLGLGGIGVWRQKLSDFGEDAGTDLLRDRGLKVSNLLWAGGFTGSDGRSFRESVDDALEAVRLAAALEADCLVLYSGARGGHTFNHARRLLDDALAQLLPAAQDLDVTVALEPMHPAFAGDWTFLTDLTDAVALVAAYGHPQLKLVFDTYHWGREPALARRITAMVPHIAIVHLADGRLAPGPEQDRTPLGAGEVPLRDIVQALEAANYGGLYDLELIGPEIETCDYLQLLQETRQTFEELHHASRIVTSPSRSAAGE
jgi:sugar phosphate isomerase/epimerase